MAKKKSGMTPLKLDKFAHKECQPKSGKSNQIIKNLLGNVGVGLVGDWLGVAESGGIRSSSMVKIAKNSYLEENYKQSL